MAGMELTFFCLNIELVLLESWEDSLYMLNMLSYVLRVYEYVISAGYYILLEQITEDFVNDWETADVFARPYGINWYS